MPPITRSDAPVSAEKLNPIFQIDGAEVIIVTQFLAAVPTSILSTPGYGVSEVLGSKAHSRFRSGHIWGDA
ncbi:MAG: hypothetical protein HOH04_17750 [Rhodospirillaceae bacterium]|nr:hypothetical protein [Rhodospirillaceae bacterium]